jgi:hypothetical protein
MKAKDINDIEINAKLLENLYRFASLAKIELEDKESVVNFSKPNHHWEVWGIDYFWDSNKAVKLGWGETKNEAMETAIVNVKKCAKNALQQQVQDWLLDMGESPVPDFLEKISIWGSTPSEYLETFKQEYTAITDEYTLSECQQALDDMLVNYAHDILVLSPILDD